MADSPLAAARALLPWWTPWANVLLALPGAALIGALAPGVAARIAGAPLRRARRAGELDDATRRRLEWPLRASVPRIRFGVALLSALATLLAGDALAFVPSTLVAPLAGVAAWIAGGLALRAVPGATAAGVDVRSRVRAVAIFASELSPLAILVAMAILVDPDRPLRAAIAAGVGIALLPALRRGGGLALLRAAHVLAPPSARLRAAVERATRGVAAKPPRVFEAELPIANAFALASIGSVVVTRRALALLDDDELAGLAGHELAHVAALQTTALRRLLGGLFWGSIAFCQLLTRWIGAWPLLISLVTLLVVAAVTARGERSREEQAADRAGVAAEGAPGAYLRGLAKLYRAAGLPLSYAARERPRRGFLDHFFGGGGIHGSFAQRAAALGALDAPLPEAERIVASANATTGSATGFRGRIVAARLAGALVAAVPLGLFVEFELMTAAIPAYAMNAPRGLVLAIGHRPVDELLERASAAIERDDAAARDAWLAAAQALGGDEDGETALQRFASELFLRPLGTHEQEQEQRGGDATPARKNGDAHESGGPR